MSAGACDYICVPVCDAENRNMTRRQEINQLRNIVCQQICNIELVIVMADPEGRGAGGPDPHPIENHTNKGFHSNTGPDPLKHLTAMCLAIIDKTF